ncbi:DNA polymerase III subunit alpha [Patescibacteria group bacterium]|nr:DNA polymerase III subunit alpha [Patescibacteria group bacterium]MBU1705905.1 DNA polymerase III subunit alpha [Patescibacteria group bacterium]
MQRFVHLHTHSHFSLLEALPKIKDLLAHVQANGQTAVALTDNGTMYGAIEFYKKAKDLGIKPIIGVDFYMAKDGRHQKRARIDTKPNRLVLLAETNEGYLNLLKLSSIGFLEGFYYKPRIDKELLRQYHEGLICLSGGYLGEIDEYLRVGNKDAAVKAIEEHVEIFGKDNFFLELVDRPEIAEQETVNAQLIDLGERLGVPVVATKNTNYLKPSDVEAWKILNCIKGGKTLEAFDRMNQYEHDASMVTPEYMEKRFAETPQAIENTRLIANRCQVELELGKWNFPVFDIPAGTTFREVLTKRAYEMAAKKFPAVTDKIKGRLDYELEIIDQKGFCPYFLIVSDFLQWSRDNGIVTTTRGSAAGSLVSYVIGISGVDPLRYKLPFERFLNPERPSAPDVDADFADNRRDEVLEYMRHKYGTDKVAQICTFGTMLARGSVRDVGRALGQPYEFCDKIAKLVPMGSQGFPMTLKRALAEEPELKKLYDTNAQVRRVIDLARQIEGCGRHVSIHAAGTVVSPSSLTDYTPIQIDTREGKVITQYEMKSVEAAGLIKFDFLGIRNLSILGDAIKLVKITKNAVIDLLEIPVDDAKTFDLLAHGNTMGVFQLGGDGMTKYLMELKPQRVEDIMAMVALYRPGPIESIPEYIQRRFDPSKVKFMDPRMEEFLDQSYGLLVYQDDVMLTAIHLAGYSWLEADKLRKAMGKKIPEEMAIQKEKLLKGFVDHGLSKTQAHDLWKLIEPFAAYGFNKAHAASYGMIAYYTAYMKANFPAEYMASIMTAESADLEKIAAAVHECQRMAIAVLPPDINESLKNFTYIDDQNIRFGLLAIKNLGEEVIESMIAERQAQGPYQDLADFVGRVNHRAFNKKSLEALIKAGALDNFGERNQLLQNLDRILVFAKQTQKDQEQNQSSLFDASPDMMNKKISLREVPPAAKRDRLAWEKELLGLYVSGHPYSALKEAFKDYLTPLAKIYDLPDGQFVKVGGIVTFAKTIMTRKGDPMAFVGLDDIDGAAELIVFPRTFKEYQDWFADDQLLLVSAKVSKREGEEAKLLANSVIGASEAELGELVSMLKSGMWITESEGSARVRQSSEPEKTEALPQFQTRGSAPPPKGLANKNLCITLPARPGPELVEELRDIFQSAPGLDRVCLIVESGGQKRRIETDYTVAVSEGLTEEVAAVVGRQNVRVEG